jgi:phage/plasmid-like protein (TIGR03299 family)
MAHEVETMMYSGETPWHGLGIYVGDDPVTSKEAIIKAEMNWTVDPKDIYISDDNGDKIIVPDYKAFVRSKDNKTLAVASPRYTPVQNEEAFSFMDSLVEEGLMKYHTAGVLRGGKNIFMLAKVGDVEVLPGDQIDKYLLLYNSHDGSKALRCFFTAVRVVCANTANAALSEAGRSGLHLKHTANIHNHLTEGREILGIAEKKFEEYEDLVKKLAHTQMNTKKLEDMVEFLFPEPPEHINSEKYLDKRNSVINLFENGVGQNLPGVAGTAWAGYNAVVEYANYFSTARGKNAQEKRFENSVLAPPTSLINRATQYLMGIAA